MPQRTINLGVAEAYSNLKTSLAKKGCRIISDEPPKRIMVKQGSLWGLSPKTAKKNVDFNLKPVDSRTQIASSSRISPDWKNITLIGCVLAAILVGLCLWMAFDLTSFIVTQKPSIWSWLSTINGNVDMQAGQAFVNLTTTLAGFLSLIILSEIAITIYVHSRIDRFAEETLNSLAT
jgi:hypothetical protein